MATFGNRTNWDGHHGHHSLFGQLASAEKQKATYKKTRKTSNPSKQYTLRTSCLFKPFVPSTYRSYRIFLRRFKHRRGVAVQVMSQQIAGALAIDTHGAIVIRKMSSCKLVKPHEFTVSEFTDTGGNLRPKLCAFFCHRALST